MLMAIAMKEAGHIIRLRGMGSIVTLTALGMKDTGRMICNMGGGGSNGLKVACTRVTIVKEKKKAMVDINGQMELYTKVSGVIIK